MRLKHNTGCSVAAGIKGLSERERQVAILLSRGLTIKEVAHELALAPKTVNKHKDNCHLKLGVHNRAQLVRMVVEYEKTSKKQRNLRET